MGSPMFPRLNVKDTERGGPRAPPRNKMALYEQLSVPSPQRFTTRSPSLLPLPLCNGATSLAPSTSSSAHGGGGRERNQFTPFCNPEKPIDYNKNLNLIRPLQPTFPNFRNLNVKKHVGEDVHTSAQNGNGIVRYIPISSNKDSSPTLKRAREFTDQSHRSIHESANKRYDGRERLVTGRKPDGDDVSDSSMVDSVSVLDISPDDVVGVMGEKHFWKARTAIVNQQRVFAVQVFELHRLIKVQRLIAESSHFLLQETLSLSKPSSKPKNLPSEPPESAMPKLPRVEEARKAPLPFYGPYSGKKPPQPIAPNPKPSPWCFPPPGNQWLVPVMSPSEGFVYKPFTGPYDPAKAGFGAYFPPYGMPVMNPSVSDSAVEQVSPLVAMSSRMSRAVSCHEVQGSTASSPSSRRVNGEALSLFPMASGSEAPAPARVIKVVPHNPRSATESAARILQLIQEERKQFD